ncbi:MAG TPA: methyltransferase domain-containing protein [Nitrospiria bacterium]|nr:methyltransferase domain-containing protein [Nitrospiria bacterium]
MSAVHHLTKTQIKRFAVQQRNAGEYYNVNDPQLEDTFRGSIDRYCDIATAFRESPRVLDAGSGNGLLLALLKLLGHEVYAVDLFDHRNDALYVKHHLPFKLCNIEADALPFEAECFDALSCCQALEHFTHSHLPPVLEMKRVLKKGGVIEIDVPNVAGFRNRSRLLRGKNITHDYKERYLYAKPVVYKGREYYPDRHNREFTKAELELLLSEAGFRDIDVRFLKSRRYRTGLDALRNIGTALKDLYPPLRKSLMAFAVK